VSAISIAAAHNDSNKDLVAANFAGVSQVAATVAADQRINDGDFAGAKAFATNALSASTISAASLRDLALAEQGIGNWQKAGALFSQNAALGWRDGPTQLWLAQIFFQMKDYSRAAERLDAALRLDVPNAALYDVLDSLAQNQDFAVVMSKRLALNPNWRHFYLGHVGNTPLPDLQARVIIFNNLKKLKSQATEDEIARVTSGLANLGDLAGARNLWFQAHSDTTSSIYDPDFKNIGRNRVPFEWSTLPILGTSLQISSDSNGHAVLHATTDGGASGVLLRQTTLLKPGRHTLMVSETGPAAAKKAFGWSIRCMKGKTLLNTLNLEASSSYQFEVEPNCDAQFIDLRVTSNPDVADKSAYFGGIRVE